MEANGKRVIALGFFDGIHRGHQALLEKTLEISRQTGAQPSVITFDVHPDALVRGEAVRLIHSAYDRRDLVRRLFGIEHMIFLHFNRELMEMPWDKFLLWLAADFRASHFVAGFDFTFGYRGEGNTEKLAALCRRQGLGCEIVPQVEQDGIRVSSTHIRRLLEKGDILTANRFLGHPYLLSGVVRSGHRLGRQLGAPTINMCFEENVLVPAHGVYAARAVLDDGQEYQAVTNIGVRPTVSGGSAVSVESNLLDFSGDLYGRMVRVEFYQFLRPEVRFPDTAALREQIMRDTEETRRFFAGQKAGEQETMV